MEKGNNQKLKIIYLMKILLERTDEKNSITMPEIIDALESYGISAERKSIYSDIEKDRIPRLLFSISSGMLTRRWCFAEMAGCMR